MSFQENPRQGCHIYRFFCILQIFELKKQYRICITELQNIVKNTDLTESFAIRTEIIFLEGLIQFNDFQTFVKKPDAVYVSIVAEEEG